MTYEERVQRVRRIATSSIGTVASEVDCTAVKQYLSNAARYLQSIGRDGVHPFFDFANFSDAAKQLEVVRSELSGAIDAIEYPLVRRVIEFYLLHGKLKPETSDLYEPLIDVFERGGYVDMQPGEIVIDGQWALPLAGWMQRFSEISTQKDRHNP